MSSEDVYALLLQEKELINVLIQVCRTSKLVVVINYEAIVR